MWLSFAIVYTLQPLVLESRLSAILLPVSSLLIHLMRSGARATSGRLQRRLRQNKSLLLWTDGRRSKRLLEKGVVISSRGLFCVEKR
jgi:hypothetical protein